MLVLSRKVDQEIVIDGNIRVRVLKVKGNTIRLGIDAPRDVHIARGELEPRDSRQATNLPKADDIAANFSVVFDTNMEPAEEKPVLLPFDESAEINRLLLKKDPSTLTVRLSFKVDFPRLSIAIDCRKSSIA